LLCLSDRVIEGSSLAKRDSQRPARRHGETSHAREALDQPAAGLRVGVQPLAALHHLSQEIFGSQKVAGSVAGPAEDVACARREPDISEVDADILGVLSVRASLTRVAGHQEVLAYPDPDPPQAALIPERPRQALRFAERGEELPKFAGTPERVSKLEAKIDRLFLRLPRLRHP